MKTDIAFDIDNTMVDFITPLKMVLSANSYHYEESMVRNFNIIPAITPEISKKQLWHFFELTFMRVGDFPIAEKAAEICTRLYTMVNDPIRFVTRRPYRVAGHTYKLVNRFCKVPYTISFAQDPYDKIDYLKDINFFVDDRRRSAMKLAEAGKTIFIPKEIWNQNIRPDFEHIDNIVYIEGIPDLFKSVNLFVK